MPRYLPHLRTKTGETSALRHLTAAAKARISPIFHVTTTPPATFAANLTQVWSGSPIALDGVFHLSATGTVREYTNLFHQIGRGGVPVIPCIPMGASSTYHAAASNLVGRYGAGLAVKCDFSQVQTIAQWISTQGWSHIDVDLVIQAGPVGQHDPRTFASYVVTTIGGAGLHSNQWRSVALAASAAPKDVSSLPTGRTVVPRRDWHLWQAIASSLPYNLDFGDFGPFHPDLTDPPGFAMARATVSVRYAVDDDWIVYKGRSTTGPRGQTMGTQYRQHARLLVGEVGFDRVAGCWADSEIQRIAGGAGSAGSRATWVAIMANRHLSLVADRLP